MLVNISILFHCLWNFCFRFVTKYWHKRHYKTKSRLEGNFIFFQNIRKFCFIFLIIYLMYFFKSLFINMQSSCNFSPEDSRRWLAIKLPTICLHARKNPHLICISSPERLESFLLLALPNSFHWRKNAPLPYVGFLSNPVIITNL